MNGMDRNQVPVTKRRPDAAAPRLDLFKDKTDSQVRGILLGLLRADGISERRARDIMRLESRSQAHRDLQAGRLAWPGNEDRTTEPRPNRNRENRRVSPSPAL